MAINYGLDTEKRKVAITRETHAPQIHEDIVSPDELEKRISNYTAKIAKLEAELVKLKAQKTEFEEDLIEVIKLTDTLPPISEEEV